MMRIHLACVECDRRDHEDVAEIPPHWHDLGAANVTDDLLEKVTGVDVISHWYTHLGVCPRCLIKRKEEVTAFTVR